MTKQHAIDNPLTITIGHEQLIIRRRYELISIINDFMIGIWFFVGSVLFLYPAQETAAVWMFIVGSFQFLFRPTIRLLAHFHVQRIPESHWEG